MNPLPSPEHPLVFFTGGSALRDLSVELATRTNNTVHIVTPFDSGGSTAALRRAFGMPAVGDMRNRLLALADKNAVPQAVLALMNRRLPEEGDPAVLRQMLAAMADTSNEIWEGIPKKFQDALYSYLQVFLDAMPATFDARHASFGNIVMAGCYLREGRRLGPMLAFFSRILRVRGQVLSSVEGNFHLAANLQGGGLIVGEHHFQNMTSPVETLFLTVHEPREGARARTACRPPAAASALARLRAASLICYPMGSFYTSVLSNLLPAGIGQTVAVAGCPKVFIPNTGHDTELRGLSLEGETHIILQTLAQDKPGIRPSECITHVCIDSGRGDYGSNLTSFGHWLAHRGIQLVDRPIVAEGGQRHIPEATADFLLEMCGRQKEI